MNSRYDLQLKNNELGACTLAERYWIEAVSAGNYHYETINYNGHKISVPVKDEGRDTGLVKDEEGRLWLIACKNSISIPMSIVQMIRRRYDGNEFFIVRPILLPPWSVSYLESNGVEIPVVNPKKWQIKIAGELPKDYFDGHYNISSSAYAHSLFFMTLVHQFNEYPDKLSVTDSIGDFVMYILQNKLTNQNEVVFEVMRAIKALRGATESLIGVDPAYIEEIYNRLYSIENNVVDCLYENNKQTELQRYVTLTALFSELACNKIVGLLGTGSSDMEII